MSNTIYFGVFQTTDYDFVIKKVKIKIGVLSMADYKSKNANIFVNIKPNNQVTVHLGVFEIPDYDFILKNAKSKMWPTFKIKLLIF